MPPPFDAAASIREIRARIPLAVAREIRVQTLGLSCNGPAQDM